MIIISNSQRQQIVRYLDMLCETLQGKDNRTLNTKRLVGRLSRRLGMKQPVGIDELRNIRKQHEG